MKKTRLVLVLAIAASAFAVSFDTQDNNGKAGRTGAPGESTCTGCHTGSALNDGVGSVTISSPDLPTWEYMPGDTYNISVTVARTGSPLFGFDCECLTVNTPIANGGTIIVSNSAETHLANFTISSVVRKNITHNLNGGHTTDSHTFTFRWAAPTTNVGNVKFYCAGNAANGDNTKLNDHIYTTSQVVTPAIGAGAMETAVTKDDFSVFPNPANENIAVTFTAGAGERVDFSLYTAEGKEAGPVYTFEGTGSSQTSSIILPADLAKGMYILRMVNGDSSTVRQIIIQ